MEAPPPAAAPRADSSARAFPGGRATCDARATCGALRTLAFLGLAAAGGLARAQAPAAAGALTVRGRLIDGTAMARSLRPEDLHGQSQATDLLQKAPRIPLAERAFRLHLLGAAGGKSWQGRTDSEGRFSLPLDLAGIPPDRTLVAEVEGTPPSFSAEVPFAGGEMEFRLYQTSESEQFLQASLDIYHWLTPNEASEGLDLEVRVVFTVTNFSGEMYVGKPRSRWTGEQGRAHRSLFRVPLPPGAALTLNQGPGGEGWRRFPGQWGWQWLLADSPAFPLFEAPKGSVFEVRYRMEADQHMAAIYPVDLDLFRFTAWGRESELTLESRGLFQDKEQRQSFRPGEAPQVSTVLFNREVQAGAEIPVGIHIDNAKLGQVNRGSLLLLCVFLLVVAGAVAGGLALGRRSASSETLLSEASGQELIERIAHLDRRRERGEVPEAEYKETRAKLISMARYLVPELAGSGSGAPAAHRKQEGAAGGPQNGLPPAAREILERIRSLETDGPAGAAGIHERALLLEELARVLSAPREGGARRSK